MKGYRKYFISFTFKTSNGSGFGNIETSYSKKINGMDDINTISRSIEQDLGLQENSLVILNFVKLN